MADNNGSSLEDILVEIRQTEIRFQEMATGDWNGLHQTVMLGMSEWFSSVNAPDQIKKKLVMNQLMFTVSEQERKKVSLKAVLDRSEPFTFKSEHLSVNASSHLDKARTPATAFEFDGFKEKQRFESEFPAELKPSTLLSMYTHATNGLKYSNEREVARYVDAALMDAVAIVNSILSQAASDTGNKIHLSARQETGLFTQRPDHAVVVDNTFGFPILVVETKRPLKADIQQPPGEVWGQLFDYIEYMRVLGHPNPYGILTTFQKSWLAWNQHDYNCAQIARKDVNQLLNREKVKTLSQAIPGTDNDGKAVVQEEPEQGIRQGCFDTHHKRKASGKQKASGRGVSTSKNRKKSQSAGQEEKGKVPQSAGQEKDRVLSVTKCHESQYLVSLLIKGIAFSMENLPGHEEPREVIPQSPFHHFVLTLSETSHKFGEIHIDVLEYDHEAMQNATEYHFVAFLGQGQTSKVHRAIASTGHECVVKMYLQQFTPNDEKLTSSDFANKAAESVTREKDLYKDIYGLDVNKVVLKGFHCLVLPLFVPIAARDRNQCLDKIRNILQTKFVISDGKKKKKFFRFTDSDISWRHCGWDSNEEVILFDLADLEEREYDQAEHNQYIESHLKKLQKLQEQIQENS